MDSQAFLAAKEQALHLLDDACSKGKVDEQVKPVLDCINAQPGYYTSSSCAGRIVILELPAIGDKKKAQFLGKWHRTVDKNEFCDACNKAEKGMIWLLAQSPIFHVYVDQLNFAEKFVKNAISCGFKNSGLRSFGKKIVVEICSTERLDAPLGLNGKMLYKDEFVEVLVDIANNVYNRSQIKLLQWEKSLKKMFK